MKRSFHKKKFKTEALSEELQPVAFENCDFENQQSISIDKTPSNFWPISILV